MSLLRHATQRDAIEPAVVRALEQHGVQVYKLDQPLDLLVYWRGFTALIELKSPGSKARTKQDKRPPAYRDMLCSATRVYLLTEAERDFVTDWRGPWTCAMSFEEAYDFLCRITKTPSTSMPRERVEPKSSSESSSGDKDSASP